MNYSNEIRGMVMICDNLSNVDNVSENLPVKFKKAFDWIKKNINKIDSSKPNRFPIDNVYPGMKVIIDINQNPKPYGSSTYENHHDFIDIQVIVEGTEWIFWCKPKSYKITEPYSKEKDIEFFASTDPIEESSCLRMEQGMFAIFWPTDWHMPSMAPFLNPEDAINAKKVVKIIIKVPVN